MRLVSCHILVEQSLLKSWSRVLSILSVTYFGKAGRALERNEVILFES